jgi:hypothetical protein
MNYSTSAAGTRIAIPPNLIYDGRRGKFDDGERRERATQSGEPDAATGDPRRALASTDPGQSNLNRLYYGDNLEVLRNEIKDESVDLVYLDPPFNSQANYNVLFKAPTGEQSHAQIEAFEDTWHWGPSAEEAFDRVMQSHNTNVAELLRAMRSFLHENDLMAYLAMMAIRLLELHRVVKPTGSLLPSQRSEREPLLENSSRRGFRRGQFCERDHMEADKRS